MRTDSHQHAAIAGATSASQPPRILIIGAGMSGILLVIKLREAGFTNLCVYEKADRPGGTWRDNTYPGLKCDVPAHMFTYSFQPNPEYAERFPYGSEILDYLRRVYDEHSVGSVVQYNRQVESVNWENGKWYVQTSNGQIEVFDIVICATGILHTPRFPEIPGRESFAGKSWHTARWNHELSLGDKRVAVIGTGSTSAQIVPCLVNTSSKVLLFQRTPQWIFPMPSKRYSEEEKERLRQDRSLGARLRRRYSKIFQWTFARAVIGNKLLLNAIEWVCLNHIRRKVSDPSLRKKLTPDFRAGCKRLIFARGFYQAIQRENAELITEGIQAIEPEGVRTTDGKLHECDVLVYATGFHAHNYMRPMHVVGKEGKTLSDAWKDGPYAHRSTSIPGFPNFFMIFGPYSPIGNYSAISVAETQVSYILKQLELLRDCGCDTIECDAQVTDVLTQKMDNAMKQTVWMSGCSSWYLNDNGKTQMWPWTFERFERELACVQPKEFHLTCSRKNDLSSDVFTLQENGTKTDRTLSQEPMDNNRLLSAATPSLELQPARATPKVP